MSSPDISYFKREGVEGDIGEVWGGEEGKNENGKLFCNFSCFLEKVLELRIVKVSGDYSKLVPHSERSLYLFISKLTKTSTLYYLSSEQT